MHVDQSALVPPLSFVGEMNWRVVNWITEHKTEIVVAGMIWVYLSILFALLFSWALTKYGYSRDEDVDIEEEFNYWKDREK